MLLVKSSRAAKPHGQKQPWPRGLHTSHRQHSTGQPVAEGREAGVSEAPPEQGTSSSGASGHWAQEVAPHSCSPPLVTSRRLYRSRQSVCPQAAAGHHGKPVPSEPSGRHLPRLGLSQLAPLWLQPQCLREAAEQTLPCSGLPSLKGAKGISTHTFSVHRAQHPCPAK